MDVYEIFTTSDVSGARYAVVEVFEMVYGIFLNIQRLLTTLIQKVLPYMLHSQAPQIHTEPSSHQRSLPLHGNPLQSPQWR